MTATHAPPETPYAPTTGGRAAGTPPPVLLLAFANDRADGERYLRNLPEERRGIRDALASAARAGMCEIADVPNATVAEVLDVFQSAEHRDRVAVLHFGGHAGSYDLLLEHADGTPHVADGGGLAAFLARQRGLQLVVLNACATEGHVRGLLDAGVPAVIATSRSVEDAMAYDFAVRLYRGLGSGAGIRRAYDEAAAAVQLARGAAARGATSASTHATAADATAADATRDIRRQAAAATDDRWPWELRVRPGSERVGGWTLGEAAGDPLFGLPRPPERDLPEQPFRHLQPFVREHAELFFGRGPEIRELYDRVVGADGAPVVLLYGQTGVGKSSLLDAGLLPRLEGTHEVRYARRDHERGLLATLVRTLDVDAAAVVARATRGTGAATGTDAAGTAGVDALAAALVGAWARVEQACGRPLLVVLDQLEEAYTRVDAASAAGAAAREIDALAAALGLVFAAAERRPRGRLVLGFRKEWLAEVEGALAAHRVPRAKQFLGRLTRAGVVEGITGPARVERLARRYGLAVEDGLAELIADDLLADRESHVAPVLQILLAEMWDAATRRDAARPLLDRALYDEVRAKGLHLDGFLTQQLAALGRWDASVVRTGLALDYLAFYTTALGTAQQRSAADEAALYPHGPATPPGMRRACMELYVLGEGGPDAQGQPTARLAHDTLAPLVRRRFEESDAPGQHARRVLESRVGDWADGAAGTPLDLRALDVVERGEAGMRAWTPDERRLVAASRAERDAVRRRRTWQRVGAGAAVALVFASAAVSFAQYRKSEARLAESESRELAGRALAIDADQREIGLLLAATAYERTPTFEARKALFTQLGEDPYVERLIAMSAREIAFSADGRSLVAHEGDTISVWDLATGGRTHAIDVTRHDDPGGGSRVHLSADGASFSGIAARDSAAQLTGVGVWDVRTGRDVGRFTLPDRWAYDVLGLPTAPGRPTLAATIDSNAIVLWNVAMGRVERRLAGGRTRIARMTASATGNTLAGLGDDGDVIVWDAATGAVRRTMRPVPATNEFALSPSGDALVTLSLDTLALWDLRDASRDWRQGSPSPTAGGLAISADGSLLAIGDSNEGYVRVISLLSRRDVMTLPTDAPQAQLIFSPTGLRLVALRTDRALVSVWDLSGSPLATRSAVPMGERDRMVALSADGRMVAVKTDSTLTSWEVGARRPVGQPVLDPGAVPQWLTVFDAAGAHVGSHVRTSADPQAPEAFVVRALPGGRRVGAIPIPSGRASLAFTVDLHGTRVAMRVSGKGAVIVRDVTDPTRADTLHDPAAPAGATRREPRDAIAFSPDGATLAWQGTVRSILLWDFAARQVRDSLVGFAQDPYAIVFSGDGRVIAVAEPNALRFWRRGSPRPFASIARLGVPGGSESTLALDADGTLVAYVGQDGAMLLADVARAEVLGPVNTARGAPVSHVAFTDAGRRLVVVSEDGAVAYVDMTPARWAERACAIARSARARDRWPIGTTAVAFPRRCASGDVPRATAGSRR